MIESGEEDETDEEKRRREACENGAAVGAVLGSAIGILSAVNADREASDRDEIETEPEGEDHTFGIFM